MSKNNLSKERGLLLIELFTVIIKIICEVTNNKKGD